MKNKEITNIKIANEPIKQKRKYSKRMTPDAILILKRLGIYKTLQRLK